MFSFSTCLVTCSWLSSACCARSSSSASLAPRTTCTPSSKAGALMMVVVRAMLPSRATAPGLASTATLAIGEPLTRCLQLSSHCGKELLEVIHRAVRENVGVVLIDKPLHPHLPQLEHLGASVGE